MRNRKTVILVSTLLLLAALALQAQNDDKRNSRGTLTAQLRPTEEVPALSTPGSGEFMATVNADGTEINYALRYSNLQGKVTQSHLHIGQFSVNGGIMIFLCSNLTSPAPPAGTQACPASGTITGTIHAANVIGPAGQGIAPGELNEVVQAIRSGVVYANVHSDLFPGGEIRGQVRFSHH
ncbi:MAG: hypothetical protein QOF89_2013 [Acidobacteriota bacterium]|jgi:hypothetical protein|nr:hypothetical protein [Acidobacteriota bacterium]